MPNFFLSLILFIIKRSEVLIIWSIFFVQFYFISKISSLILYLKSKLRQIFVIETKHRIFISNFIFKVKFGLNFVFISKYRLQYYLNMDNFGFSFPH